MTTRLMMDLRHGLRLLRRNPAFAAISITALALGIGANAAMFSIVNAVLVQPLPFPQPDRLAFIFETSPAQGWNQIGPSGPDFADIREQAKTLEDVAMIEPGSGTVLGFGEPRQMPGLRVTNNLFRLLGKKPARGRDFEPEEGYQNRVGMLSYAGARKLFGNDTSVTGRSIVIDDIPYTGIGVMPPDMWFPLPADLFAPWNTEDLRRQDRMDHRFVMIARLKPGVTFRQASAEVNTIVHRIGQREPRMKGWGAAVTPMQDVLVHNVKPALLVLQGAVGLVLLIACTNLASLALARASARHRELAVRMALGAKRIALMRQFFAEAIVLGLLGGLAGIFLTAWGVALLNHVLPATISAGESNAQIVRPEIVLDGTVLLFTLGLSLLTGLLFGIAPAISASRADVNEALKEGGRNSGSAQSRRISGTLVVAEVALALMLLVCAGLTLKSFWALRQTSPGFMADRALTLQIELPTDAKYRKPGEQAAFFRQVLANVQQIPGVRDAGVTSSLPLREDGQKTDFNIAGRPLPPSGQLLPADYRAVSDGYFAAMAIPLVRGRGITAQDYFGRPRVAVIDEALARRYWPAGADAARDPIGQRLVIGGNTFEIVGIVGKVMSGGVDRRPQPTIYTSYLQEEQARMTLVVRHPQPAQIIPAAKQAVYAVDRDQPVYDVSTMDQVVNGSSGSLRLTFLLLGVFATAALALAAVGIYGVISYTVAQRTTEIGIRMALGAGRRSVIRLVAGQGFTLTIIGIAAGTAGSLVASRFLESLLYGVSRRDPLIFVGTALALALVGACASLLPALRATRIDPITSLRYQ